MSSFKPLPVVLGLAGVALTTTAVLPLLRRLLHRDVTKQVTSSSSPCVGVERQDPCSSSSSSSVLSSSSKSDDERNEENENGMDEQHSHSHSLSSSHLSSHPVSLAPCFSPSPQPQTLLVSPQGSPANLSPAHNEHLSSQSLQLRDAQTPVEHESRHTPAAVQLDAPVTPVESDHVLATDDQVSPIIEEEHVPVVDAQTPVEHKSRDTPADVQLDASVTPVESDGVLATDDEVSAMIEDEPVPVNDVQAAVEHESRDTSADEHMPVNDVQAAVEHESRDTPADVHLGVSVAPVESDRVLIMDDEITAVVEEQPVSVDHLQRILEAQSPAEDKMEEGLSASLEITDDIVEEVVVVEAVPSTPVQNAPIIEDEVISSVAEEAASVDVLLGAQLDTSASAIHNHIDDPALLTESPDDVVQVEVSADAQETHVQPAENVLIGSHVIEEETTASAAVAADDVEPVEIVEVDSDVEHDSCGATLASDDTKASLETMEPPATQDATAHADTQPDSSGPEVQRTCSTHSELEPEDNAGETDGRVAGSVDDVVTLVEEVGAPTQDLNDDAVLVASMAEGNTSVVNIDEESLTTAMTNNIANQMHMVEQNMEDENSTMMTETEDQMIETSGEQAASETLDRVMSEGVTENVEEVVEMEEVVDAVQTPTMHLEASDIVMDEEMETDGPTLQEVAEDAEMGLTMTQVDVFDAEDSSPAATPSEQEWMATEGSSMGNSSMGE